MRTVLRITRWLVAIVTACAVGILPSCASMGGGGMKYDVLFDSSVVFAEMIPI
jgi:hypothetical protein